MHLQAGHLVALACWRLLGCVVGLFRWSVLAGCWLRRTCRPSPRRPLPPPDDPLLLVPASTLADDIRSGKVSSERVVRAYAARVRRVEPLLGAVVAERLDAAVQDAKRVDRLLAAGTAPSRDQCPLLGVPFTVKGSLAVAGLEHSSGQLSRAGLVAGSDSEAVRRLRRAGAIPLLVSRTPEYCLFTETHSPLAPPTLNPYDTRRTPGGSSGGEAALLGAAASVIGVGSDVGGSVRLPALNCGVFGHKQSPGLVPDTGHVPVASDERWPRIFTVSPMCRYACDLPLVLSAMSGPEARLLQLDKPVDLQKLRVFYMENDGGCATTEAVHPELVAAMRKVVSALEVRNGIKPKKVHIKGFRKSFQLSFATLAPTEGLMQPMEPKMYENLTMALFEYLRGRLPHNAYILMFNFGRKLVNIIPKEGYKQVENQVAQLREEITELLGDDGVLLYPVHPTPATYLNEQYGRILNITYTAIFNVLGLPATHCPTGLGNQGLPLGVQVVAGPNQDRLNLAVARELERALGGWVPA